MMSNVKLAVRLRPFTERELKSEKDCVPVVSVVDENTVTITNIKVSVSGAGDSRERVRPYYADYTFDSSCPDFHPDYASQEKVFETIGRQVVASMSQGSSACVLAYGQSSTGKTYTMMGSEDNPGLVPRICKALSEDSRLGITVSFLEIYNERVHDLLVGDVTCHSLPRRRGNTRKDLRVREHPTKGPYVQNLRRVAVHDIDSLLSLVEEGARRRRTAATRRNPASSRSHAVLELATARCTLHLADLAGSEKASWEGCGGGRQKEGANINKSLVALSNVISALVSGGSRGRFVPYRDSALTWLLKDCFTGGASTFIIATISPSAACYGESASTLRWAARARQLPITKVQASAPSSASKAALQAQLDQLIAELTRNYIRYTPETGKITYDDNHWALNVNEKSQSCSIKKDAKIGNLINMLNSKTETRNSESTASSVTSGSSDVINTMDKNIKEEVSKEVDKVFGPALERTKSGSEIEITAPLRNKRRQYKSQEVLPIDKNLQVIHRNVSASQERMNVQSESSDKIKQPPVPILYDNQRAEIVASVTERLYTKLKKKEEATVAKVESVVDRKIMEPLSELRICTNARQRLMELSQRAMRNKRRIGIPAHTQTKVTVTRVKDQGIDVQTDLETYIARKEKSCTLQRDVSTETVATTPRCKEIAVGSKYGYLSFHDRSTLTENKPVVRKNSFAMTDIISKYDCCTQTPVVPPPRRKKRSPSVPSCFQCDDVTRKCVDLHSLTPMISINISQQYPVESDTESSDDNMEIENTDCQLPPTVNTKPDLLNNHNTITACEHDTDVSSKASEVEACEDIKGSSNGENTSVCQEHYFYTENNRDEEEFSDSECSLPRVHVNSSKAAKQDDIKDIILGRNEDLYPYNILLSPPRERDEMKKIVKFKDSMMIPKVEESNEEWEEDKNNSKKSHSPIPNSERESDYAIESLSACSESTDSRETNSFVWKQPNTPRLEHNIMNKGHLPVYKSDSRYKTTKARVYREFLGLDKYEEEPAYTDYPKFSSLTNFNDFKDISSSGSTDNARATDRYKQRRHFYENNVKANNEDANEKYNILEKKILDACSSLDMSVNKYQRYLTNYKRTTNKNMKKTPTEYLQHLVKLRKEVVKAECDLNS